MLLAIAERPPQRTAIIFMSSEPDKLDPALRSRCLEFEVTPLTRTETIELLERGCVAAGVRLGDEVLRQIAKVSRGNPRNALIKLGSALNRAEAERKNNILMQQEIRHVQRTY
jgi:DNA polymerase III delta prime subunit